MAPTDALLDSHEQRISVLEGGYSLQMATLARIESKIDSQGEKLDNYVAALESHKVDDAAVHQTVAILKDAADKRESRKVMTWSAYITAALGLLVSLALHALKAFAK